MSKRELIGIGPDKRCLQVQLKGSVGVVRSLSADKRHDAESDAEPGQGDKSDREFM